MLPKHILVARTQGVEAGMDAYMASPISKLHAPYKEIDRKRTAKSKLDTYCRLFADKLDGQTSDPVRADRAIGDLQALVEATVARVLAQVEDGDVEFNDPDEAVVAPVIANRRKKAVTNTISAGAAWTALGADDAFKPKDLDKPANNGQLYAMNVRGMLAQR